MASLRRPHAGSTDPTQPVRLKVFAAPVSTPAGISPPTAATAAFLTRLNGKRQCFPGERCRKLQTHRRRAVDVPALTRS